MSHQTIPVSDDDWSLIVEGPCSALLQLATYGEVRIRAESEKPDQSDIGGIRMTSSGLREFGLKDIPADQKIYGRAMQEPEKIEVLFV